LRNVTHIMVGILVLSMGGVLLEGRAAEKPNVIIILADDLGYADVGFQGLGDIPTPNLDRLASAGVRCTSGYVCWTACSPSRAGLITGQDPHRFGFYDNPNPVLAVNQGLPPGIMTVPRALQQQGYVTAGIGKWHLGTTPDRHPNRMGFTEWYGFLGGGHEYFPRDTYTTWNKGAKTKYPQRPWPEWFVNHTLPIVRNSDTVKTQRYLTDEFTSEAVSFIKRHPQNPFFLYLSYNAPHSPYEAPEDEEALLDVNKMAKVPGVTAAQRRTYAAMITRLDKGVGEVLAALKTSGLEEKTLIFFLSDNGGGHSGPGYYSSNHPLRGYKGDLYEGGIRVPFVVNWKGKLPAGSVYQHPVTSLDIGATALALAGGAPAQMKLDGVNLVPFLSGQRKEAPHERVCVKRQGLGMVREGRYKLITGVGKRAHELYDVESDLGETKNLAAENPELARRLDTAWQTWNAQMAPPLWKPVPEKEWKRPEYQPPLMPDERVAQP
jgi:arylsulfatase B